jgi:hypothetical protein
MRRNWAIFERIVTQPTIESMKSSHTITLPGKMGWSMASRMLAKTGGRRVLRNMERLLKRMPRGARDLGQFLKIT